MSYQFDPKRMYRMPTHFGPSLGPRQGPDGRKFRNVTSPRTTAYGVSFLSNAGQLEALLPPGFALAGEPVVTVTYQYIAEIEWLAGRGYNTLGVAFPAVFKGERDQAAGELLTVLWENMCDPIITGREELGFAKIPCELPPPRVIGGMTELTALWQGFPFMHMHLSDMVQDPTPEPAAPPPAGELRGTLHYKYIPRTGEWGEADVAYAVLTPAYPANRRVLEAWHGQGKVEFRHARWEDMPTQYHIVNAFHELEVREWRGATLVRSVGAKDLGDQRILR